MAAAMSITAANVLPGTGAKTKTGISGGTLTAGAAIYEDETDSKKLKLADADALASSVVKGIALNGASAGQPVSYLTEGLITIGGTVTIGVPYFLHTTAGGIGLLGDLTAGDYVTYLGTGISATQIDVMIHSSQFTVQA